MNHDNQNKPDIHTLIDPELEARIVAWVAGEASAFEAAELTRLTGEKPELAIFKRRIETVHGLAGEAVRTDKEPLRLSSERRAKLLQTIGEREGQSTPAAERKVEAPTFPTAKKIRRKDRQWLLAIAACITAGFFTFLTLPYFGKRREAELDQAAQMVKRDEALLSAEQDFKNREPVITTELSAVPFRKNGTPGDFESQDSAKPKQANPSTRPANKKQIEQLARFSKEEAEEVRARRLSRSFGVGRSDAPVMDAFNTQLRGGTIARPKETMKTWGGTFQGPAKDKVVSNYSGDTVNPGEEQLVLSPFTITSSNDKGYVAANTVAGSRLHTELKDVGSAITVTSSQFLREAGAINEEARSQPRGNLAASGAIPLATSRDPNSIAYGIAGPISPTSESISRLPLNVETLAAAGHDTKKQLHDEISVLVIDGSGTEKSGNERVNDDLPLALPSQKPLPTAAPVETNASKEPVSTFSLHVSDVSFRLAQAALASNEAIDPARIRPEEFYNAFNYGDPTPALAEKVSCRIEQAAHPFLQQRNLIRIATKVAAAGRDAAQPLHLTVLLDNSGSMEREDRAAVVHRAMEALVSLLGPNDRITLIGFARQPTLLAESVSGDDARQILDIIARIPAQGGTNLEEALKLGGELARRHFEITARNRIVLLTDGAANLGNAKPAQLANAIEILRQQGIAFDACGVGLEGLDDAMLENLTRKGDGRYYVINTPEAADAGFAHQLAGAFRPAAENVKLQVRFNPARVGNYRLIGFEQHRLREEDFRNDSVDAAELAAEEAAVAVYQVETLPQGEGEIGEVYVRFRDAASGAMVERSWTLSYDPQSPAFDRAPPSMQLAGTAALLAEKLRGGQAGEAIRLSELAPIVNKLRSHYANEPRVQELVTMFEQMRRQSGE